MLTRLSYMQQLRNHHTNGLYTGPAVPAEPSGDMYERDDDYEYSPTEGVVLSPTSPSPYEFPYAYSPVYAYSP